MNSLPGSRPTFAGLPDDIICELYMALETIDAPRGPPIRRSSDPALLELEHGKPSPSLGWITLTHICRRLRNIGIGYLPALWGRVVCVFPSAHAWETTLARSRSAPLVLDTRDIRLRAVIPWPLPAHALARARAIRDIVHSRHPDDRRWWTDATLPSLEFIELSYDYEREPYRPSGLIGHIFAPALLDYTIRDGFISFHAQSLRRLVVGNLVVWTLLLESLRSCPLLEQLSIHDTRQPSEPQRGTLAPVPLLCLQYITLSSPSDESVCKLLDHLHLPSTTKVDGPHCHSPVVFRNLLALRKLRSKPASPNMLRISAVRSLTDGTRCLLLSVAEYWRTANTPYTSPWMHSGADCGLARREEPGILDNAELVGLLEDAFSPSAALDIHVLVFRDDCDRFDSVGPLPYSVDGCERLGVTLRAFAAVTILYVQRRSTAVLELLRASLERAEETGSDAEALFPELETIVLDIRTEKLQEVEWRIVMGILAYRKAGGRPLVRLVLMGTHLCHMSPDRDPGVTKLRIALGPVKKLVGEVVDLRGGKRCTCTKYC